MNQYNAWMIYAGTNSTDLGVVLRAAPTIGSAVRRVSEKVDIPGRHGTVIESDGAFMPVSITVKLACTKMADRSMIRKWLMSGAGELVFGDNPDRCYVNAQIIREFKFTPAGIGRTGRYEFDVTFQADPMQESFGAHFVKLKDEAQVVNPGHFDTAPLLRVKGKGDISFAQGDDVQTITIDRDIGAVYIDCDTGYAFTASCGKDPFDYTDESVMPDIARGDLIRLKPGAYTVSMDSTITEALMRPRWRWA